MNILNPTIAKYGLVYDFSKKKKTFSDLEIGARFRRIDEKCQGPKFKRFIKAVSLISFVLAPFLLSRE
jgi:hypothetical protein